MAKTRQMNTVGKVRKELNRTQAKLFRSINPLTGFLECTLATVKAPKKMRRMEHGANSRESVRLIISVKATTQGEQIEVANVLELFRGIGSN